MSHTPRLSSGYVFKRYLNAIRPQASGVVPPVNVFTIYRATAEFPADTVVPPPSTERALFMTHLDVSQVFTFEAMATGPVASFAAPLNGGTCQIEFLAGNGRVRDAPLDGAFNTTAGGSKYGYEDIYPYDDLGGPSVVFTFGTPVAAFGAYFTDTGESLFGNGIVQATIYRESDNAPFVYDINTVTGTSGTLVFWGFTDTTGERWTKIELTLDLPPGDFTIDPIGIDDVIYALSGDVHD